MSDTVVKIKSYNGGKQAMEGLKNGTDTPVKPMRPLQLKRSLP